jgi:hypothetical protein
MTYAVLEGPAPSTVGPLDDAAIALRLGKCRIFTEKPSRMTSRSPVCTFVPFLFNMIGSCRLHPFTVKQSKHDTWVGSYKKSLHYIIK